MQTLGLASEQQPTDGLFKRLFWPTIENQYDVDLVRTQGFWLCAIVAVMSAVSSFATHTPFVSALVCVTYLLAGMGVREGSIGAAIMIFLCFLGDRVVAMEQMMIGFGAGSPFVGIFALALLLSNIRGTILSRRWQQEVSERHSPDDLEKSTSSLGDKLSNVVPAAVWPKGQYVFFPLAAGLLLLTGIVMVRLPSIQKRHAVDSEQRPKMQMTLPVR